MATKRKPTPKLATIYDDFVAGVKYHDIGAAEIVVGMPLCLFWEQGNPKTPMLFESRHKTK